MVSENAVVVPDHVPDVDADPEGDAGRPPDLALDLDGRAHRRHGAVEHGQRAVPVVLDQLTVPPRRRPVDGVPVASSQTTGLGLVRLHRRSRAYDVGEDDGAEATAHCMRGLLRLSRTAAPQAGHSARSPVRGFIGMRRRSRSTVSGSSDAR